MTDRHKYATINGEDYRLAPWVPRDERFQDIYIPLDPALRFLPNRGDGLVADEGSTYWSVKDWSAGEGEEQWEPNRPAFHVSSNVTRQRRGDGLVLGPKRSATVDSGGVTRFNDGGRFGYGLGKVWTLDDSDAYSWDVTNSRWSAAVSTGGGTSDATSLTDGDDTFMYSGHEDTTIRRWKSASNAEWYGTGTGDDFTYAPVLRSFGGLLYALDGDDLYLVDKDTADTRTLKSDPVGSSGEYLGATPWTYGRMSVSDKGPIWIQRLDNGQAFLWEFNAAQDVAARIGRIPVTLAFPYSCMFALGFYFIAFRNASAHDEEGDGYIYFQRGAQRGVLPPIRSLTGSTASKPVLLAGVDGDDLLFYFDGAMWAYNLSEGGVFQLATQSTTGTPEDAITVGASSFLSPVTESGDTQAVEWMDRLNYTTASATLETGRYDLAYFDIPKLFLDVTVFTEPLAANTSVTLSYAVDDGSFTAATGTHDTDNATTFTWDLSTTGTTVRGRQIELRLEPATTDDTATPTIRGFLVRAISGTHERRLVFAIDCSTDDSGEQLGEQVLDNLRTLAATDAIVSVSLPFESREETADESIDCAVRTVRLPEIQTAQPTAIVELQQKALTT